MNKIKELKLLTVWVNPEHLVSTARHIMSGHRLRAVGVLEGQRLIGILTSEDAAAAPQDALVASVARPPIEVIQADDDIRSVADTFSSQGTDYAPVVDDNRFVGMVTATMLLQELGRSYDPLTQLSWSDRLREWGVEHLKQGQEVTIIFIDVNKFGQYNKKYGHIVGDRVLQKLADFLRESIDPDDEVLVRYGGDEFAIGTLKHRPEAEDLADSLLKRMAEISISETEEPVTFNVGVFGGRRVRERENIHYQSTLDNLINIASRACIEAKNVGRIPAEPPPELPTHALIEIPEPTSRYRVVGIYADEKQVRGVATVIISMGDAVFSGAHSRTSESVLSSVALATARALERANPGVQISVDLVELSPGEGSILVQGKAAQNGHSRELRAERKVEKDRLMTTAETMIAAFAEG